MKKSILNLVCCLLLCFVAFQGFAQNLDYYLPKKDYLANIPTPESVIGHPVGKWHITHDKLLYYMRAVAQASDRVTLVEQGKSFEDRTTIYLVITSPKNHAQIDKLKEAHIKLTFPEQSTTLQTANMPVVVWAGYSIHGNESSGSNASMLAAYYWAAAPDIDHILDNTIILLDPSYNPDGLQRFSTWANMHKNKNLTDDPNDREYNEVWPKGRTNHYWFDLNRDWLVGQLPESQARIRSFHAWKPNILTDHHEMGSNSTYFFQPGVPSRKNPLTPLKNVRLTEKIGTYHAAILDSIQSLYFTQERFDDFYYGKGSTFPDAQGSIGILFEQASSRGHLQKTSNGLLSFPKTIRNQFCTSISTVLAAYDMRKELLDYQRDFYLNTAEEAKKDTYKAYVFSEKYDQTRLNALIDIFHKQQIKVYRVKSSTKIGGTTYKKFYVVPLEQQQSKLIKAIFQLRTSFEDSLFYDVSAWTLGYSFNIDFKRVSQKKLNGYGKLELLEKTPLARGKLIDGNAQVGYAFYAHDYLSHKLIYALQKADINVKVTTRNFSTKDQSFEAGTLLVPLGIQTKDAEEVKHVLEREAAKTGVDVYPLSTGLAVSGSDLGSPSMYTLKKPKVALVVGDGVKSYDAGEVWHLLDQRYDIPLTQLKNRKLSKQKLTPYNVLVMVHGNYGNKQVVQEWVRDGGTLILMSGAGEWANKAKLIDIDYYKTPKPDSSQYRAYAHIRRDLGAKYIGGAIFNAKIDKTNPLFYGYTQDELPVFKNNRIFMKKNSNIYSNPAYYDSKPLLSGYISKDNLELLSKSTVVSTHAIGKGRVVVMDINPNFRAFWYGTNKLFMNAIFFGNMLSSSAME